MTLKVTSDLRLIERGDEPLSNPSDNTTFARVLEARFGRRDLLKGGLGAAVVGLFGGVGLAGCNSSGSGSGKGAGDGSAAPGQLLGFEPVPVSELDEIVVPEGYSFQVIGRWGDPIIGGAPAFALDNTGADQAGQIGSHHDGMHFFPIEGEDPDEGSSEDGLLVLNHEYVESRYMHAAAVGQELNAWAVTFKEDLSRDADEVLKEMNAHGVSIYRINKSGDNTWSIQYDSRNRRITGLTHMEIQGPVRGSDLVRTRYSPQGHATRGTLNNCAHGVTPWNTYLAAEENWAGYFCNADEVLPREHSRYGVIGGSFSRYNWHRADSGADAYVRFDASSTGADATEDYRNEPNCFGWMVEIDPFDPDSTPQKRTAMGRFAHEGVVFQPAEDGRPVVCYSGDDARFEYIYKFVSAQAFFRNTAGGHLLDTGTLYVASFNEDGTGDWLPLVYGQNGLTEANGFSSQADVLVNTRLAADFVGATKMDRPEWGAVDPNTRQVYFTLTNNTRRDEDDTDAVNPRGPNYHGHIIRWREQGDDPAALAFTWDLFAIAGDSSGPDTLTGGRDGAGNALTEDNKFSSPDGLWIDRDSRIWIQMDMSESVMNVNPDYAMMGNNSMLAADPISGEIRRFLTGPLGQEITGVITTPDQRTMFINVQHPGATTSAEDFAAGQLTGTWPDHNGGYARSATVVIWKDDGGKVGT
ncbi:MAG: PhoX family phosphatase [Ectothiorhodospiraceae bacterium]|nr:PhoX family phosphatase [Ectothiorhodospiraceae bacterium]